jgi:hypothetical protein
MAEQLAFQQAERDCSAVHFYEGVAAPLTDIVNEFGDASLAGVAQPLPFRQKGLASTQIFFGASALGYVRIDLENSDGVAALVMLQRPPAGYHDSPPAPPRLDKFSLPSAIPDYGLRKVLDPPGYSEPRSS